jgi:hypothetical protein
MRKFQIGDDVRCVSNIDVLNNRPFLNLTVGKVYRVIDIGYANGLHYIEIENDRSAICGFYESRFEKVEDIIEEKELNFLDILKGY